MHRALAARLTTAPRLTRPAFACERVDYWRAGLDAGDPLLALLGETAVAALIQALADHSPYLWRLISTEPARVAAILAADPQVHLAGCLAELDRRCEEPGVGLSDVMRILRRAKAETALLVALADLGGVWNLDEVTDALTHFADSAVRAAVRVLLREAHRSGKLSLPDPARPEDGCGLAILALGKQGAVELNYSSDIDIVAFFDPQAAAAPPQPAPVYVRLVQTLARVLSERTGDGYVLRVDLRLRPDPGSTAVAIGLPSAFSYYESIGQNWERAALIKARPVAGDLGLGAAFLRDLAPFIWRKYFDYAAIADIHAMKRQVQAVRGHGRIDVPGHDVKLGRGGIREIEFFVQTQQLIFGGRRPHLRGARTLDMLDALSRDGWIDGAAVTALSVAYRFLRGIEHRLQMINDEQTQRLPRDGDAIDAFAAFAGFDSGAAFATVFMTHAEAVERHYAQLFEQADGRDGEGGPLVFTGAAVDPATLATLAAWGFRRPDAAAELVRGWQDARCPASQGTRARAALVDLLPRLLVSFARSGDPDAALLAFDTMLGQKPAVGELFALLNANSALLELFGDILGLAPRLAATIAARPHVLDGAIDPASLAIAGDPVRLEARVGTMLGVAGSAEEFLDRMRDLAQEEMFLIGVRLLAGTDSPQRSGEAFSDLAAILVRAALRQVTTLFAALHGVIEGGACVVVAMGKLGSREMTATSDLDLLLVYDVDPGRPDSTGPQVLDATRYFTRLTQRLIAALTAATRRGRLYDVDMRLRPSGGQGPLATRLSSFVAYQATAATWEHQALTRARVIAGDVALGARVTAAIRAVLTMRRDQATIARDVRVMRALIATEKGDAGPWDIKLTAGGLLDVEFFAQSLVLSHAADHPGLLTTSTTEVIAQATAAGLIGEDHGQSLLEAHRLLTSLLQMTRLTSAGRFDPATAGVGVRRRLALAAHLPDFDRVEADLRVTLALVRAACPWP